MAGKTAVGVAVVVAAGGLWAGAIGCDINPDVRTLQPSQFVRDRPAVGPNPIGQPVGESGQLMYGELHAPLVPEDVGPGVVHAPMVAISPELQRQIPGPGRGAGANVPLLKMSGPATAPAAAGAEHRYQAVGTVIAEVNGTPIYADKVLASIERQLAAEAHKYGPDDFQMVARKDITDRVQELVNSELEVAAYSRELSPESKSQAEVRAQIWRTQQISAAGGSLEMARRRALEQGTSFEEQVEEQHKFWLVMIFLQQHLEPRIHVSAAELRQYYREHLDAEFTTHAAVKYRRIEFTSDRSGSWERATENADHVIQLLKGSPDLASAFDKLARQYNDNPNLMRDGGEEGWVAKGSLRSDKLEQALWALQPGQYTDHPIQDPDENRVYVVYMEARRPGAVKSFDDPDVQETITNKLRAAQRAELRMQYLTRARNDLFATDVPGGLETAVQMAGARYPAWAAAR